MAGKAKGIVGIFGTPQELRDFSEIFFGSLALALVYFLYRHFTSGIAKPGTKRFNLTMLGLAFWCFMGMVIDGWAHTHGEVDDSFFTKWHGLWYSGFTAYACYVIFSLWQIHDGPIPKSPSAIKQFLQGMPSGYNVGVTGMVVFAVSGFGDMLWHSFFGIEGGTDILLSPTHLGLAAGLILSLMVPTMVAWHDPNSGQNLKSQIPIVFGLGCAWSVITLFTIYTNHLTLSYVEICMGKGCQLGTEGLERGITAITFQSMIMAGFILFFLKRWKAKFGVFTVMLAVNGVAVAAFAQGELKEAWKHFMTPLLTGILLDIVYKLYGDRTRLFSFLIPTISVLAWYVMLVLIGGYNNLLGWTIHATIGIIFIAGSASLMMCILSETDTGLAQGN